MLKIRIPSFGPQMSETVIEPAQRGNVGKTVQVIVIFRILPVGIGPKWRQLRILHIPEKMSTMETKSFMNLYTKLFIHKVVVSNPNQISMKLPILQIIN